MKLIKFCLILVISLVFASLVQAEAEIAPEPTLLADAVIEDQVTAQDLGVAEPTLLPDNAFYFLKDWQRALKLTFTFNQLKKTELRQQIINEKLIELKALAEKTQNTTVLEKAALGSQKSIEQLKTQIDKFKDKASQNPEVDKFLEKFVNQGLLQQRVLEKLEAQVPEQAMEKIQAVRERHMERFGQVMSQLDDKEKIAPRISNALEHQAGSSFKALNDLKVLNELEEVLPDEIKGMVEQHRIQLLERFRLQLEQMPAETQEKIGDYLENMSGDKEKKLEILETIKQATTTVQVRGKLENAKTKIIDQIKALPQGLACPEWTSPAPGFCPNGRVVINKDVETGCRLPAKCIQETNVAACTTLWSPVCGADGKTYSNQCFARIAGVTVKYKGQCKEEPADCDSKPVCKAVGTRSEGWYNSCTGKLIRYENCGPGSAQASCRKLWWFDNDNRTCQQKEWCGTYMYLGLQTFENKEDCLNALKGSN